MRHSIKTLLTIAMMSSTWSAQAAESDCLTRIIYAEARGESLTGLIAVGHATVNRAKRIRKTACSVPGVSRATPPASEYAAFKTVATGILSGAIKNPVKQANAWNTGKTPRQPGDVMRVIGNSVAFINSDIRALLMSIRLDLEQLEDAA